jgi:hypothetical protein
LKREGGKKNGVWVVVQHWSEPNWNRTRNELKPN